MKQKQHLLDKETQEKQRRLRWIYGTVNQKQYLSYNKTQEKQRRLRQAARLKDLIKDIKEEVVL